MKRTKRLAVLLLTAVLLCGNIIFNRVSVNAANDIMVVLDGNMLTFDVPPQIINDRTMVPYRMIGESMGAMVGWEGEQKKITMYLNTSYVILYIGSANMTYGTFSTDEYGKVNAETSNVSTLDAPPVIVNDRTLVPIRAITEGLGAVVDWDKITRTVYITSPYVPEPTPLPTPTPTPEPTPTPTPTPSPTPDTTFDNTSYFEEISGRRAQSMFESNEKFIMVYYSSLDEESAKFLPIIKDAAFSQRYKIYGVDIDSKNFDNTGDILQFILKYINRSRFPAIFFVNGNLDVEVYVKPTEQLRIEDYISGFLRKSLATPSPTASGAALPNIADKTIFTGKGDLTTMYNRGDKFIYFYYNSADTNSQYKANSIMQAAINTGITIYATDTYKLINESPWGTQFTNGKLIYPTIFYVYGVNDVKTVTDIGTTIDLESSFYNFKNGTR